MIYISQYCKLYFPLQREEGSKTWFMSLTFTMGVLVIGLGAQSPFEG